MAHQGYGGASLGLRPQNKDPIHDLPTAGTEYQISMGRVPYGLPSTKDAKYTIASNRGRATQILPSQGSMKAPFLAPKRAQAPTLRQERVANGEINRMRNDPEFQVNKSHFYAATPTQQDMLRKDEGRFHRGFTPKRDKWSLERSQKTIQKNAERILTKSHSAAMLPQLGKDYSDETRKFFGVDTPTQAPDNVMDRLPDTIRQEYPETFHEMRRKSNHNSFPAQMPAAKGTHSDPTAKPNSGALQRDIDGTQYYNDVHLQRANGFAPQTDISKEHADVEKNMRVREGTRWGEGVDYLGKVLNDPKAYRTARERTFAYNLINNHGAIGQL